MIETEVSVREHLALAERVAVLETSVKIAHEALLKQALEYERRLDALNHENARVLAMQSTCVSVDVHKAEIEAIREKSEKGAVDIITVTGKAGWLERQLMEVQTSNQWLARLVATALLSSVASIIVFLVTRGVK